MNEHMLKEKEPGELYALEVYDEKEEHLLTVSYQDNMKAELMDIIMLLARRGYIIKILYHFNN